MGSLYQNSAAEKEADDVGRRFMNSSDVLADMGKAYGRDLKSEVTLHDDAEADSKVRSIHRDALATGNDIYFSKGSLDGSKESNQLLGHEAAHVIQQSGGNGMSQTASFGAMQGGLFSYSLTNKVAPGLNYARVYRKRFTNYVKNPDGQFVEYTGNVVDASNVQEAVAPNKVDVKKGQDKQPSDKKLGIDYTYNEENDRHVDESQSPIRAEGEFAAKDKLESFFAVPNFAPYTRKGGERKFSFKEKALTYLGRIGTSLPVIGEILGGAMGAKGAGEGHRIKGFLHGMKRGAIARTIVGATGAVTGALRGLYGFGKWALGKVTGKKNWAASGKSNMWKGAGMLGSGLMNTAIGGGTIAGSVLGPLGVAAGLGSAGAATALSTGLGAVGASGVLGSLGLGTAAATGAGLGIAGGAIGAGTGVMGGSLALGLGLDRARNMLDKKTEAQDKLAKREMILTNPAYSGGLDGGEEDGSSLNRSFSEDEGEDARDDVNRDSDAE